LLLALLLAVSLFAGCKKNDGDASSQDSASKDTTSLSNIEEVDKYQEEGHPTLPDSFDLGGFEMTYAVFETAQIIPEEGKSVEGDLILEALREVQETYNCVINVREVNVTDWDSAMTAIVAGEEFANVIMPRIHQSGGFLQSRLCADYLSPEISKYIDMKNPWWNDTMAYASNVLGSVYAGCSAIVCPADSTYITFFNVDILNEIGVKPEELYTLWEKKEWNWDAFVKYAKRANKDIDGSGAMDSVEDRWGFVCPGYDTAQAFCSSASVASCTTTDGMNPTYSFNTAHCISTLTKLNKIFTTEGIYTNLSWSNSIPMFTSGKGLFWFAGLAMVGYKPIREMEDDFGILPMPLGPKADGGWQDEYMSRVDHNTNLCIIPVTVSNKEYTAFVLEAMTFKYFTIINDKVDTYANLYCRDDKSVEVANTIYNTSCFEISQFLYGINGGAYNTGVETKIRDIVNIANYDVSGQMNSCADLAQQMIDDYFNGL